MEELLRCKIDPTIRPVHLSHQDVLKVVTENEREDPVHPVEEEFLEPIIISKLFLHTLQMLVVFWTQDIGRQEWDEKAPFRSTISCPKVMKV